MKRDDKVISFISWSMSAKIAANRYPIHARTNQRSSFRAHSCP